MYGETGVVRQKLHIEEPMAQQVELGYILVGHFWGTRSTLMLYGALQVVGPHKSLERGSVRQ